MKFSVFFLTILLIVAVAMVGAKNIFRRPAADPAVTQERDRALRDALQNGMLSETDYQQASKKLVLLTAPTELNSGAKKSESSNPPQP